MKKSRYLSIHVIPDDTGRTWGMRIRYAYIKAGFYGLFALFIGLSFVAYKTAETIAEHLQIKKSELLKKQLQIDMLEKELARLGDQERIIRNIIDAYAHGLIEEDPVRDNAVIPSGLITKEYLKDYVTKIKAISDAKVGQRTALTEFPNIWPVRGVISQHYALGEGSEHPGIDIIAPDNSIITSTGRGIVTKAGWDRDLGKMVVIDHGSRIQTIYGHLNRRLVQVGDHVEKGSSIGTLGNTGNSTGPHLHYEIRMNGKPINPEQFLK